MTALFLSVQSTVCTMALYPFANFGCPSHLCYVLCLRRCVYVWTSFLFRPSSPSGSELQSCPHDSTKPFKCILPFLCILIVVFNIIIKLSYPILSYPILSCGIHFSTAVSIVHCHASCTSTAHLASKHTLSSHSS